MKYSVIYADPPWPGRQSAGLYWSAKKRGVKHDGKIYNSLSRKQLLSMSSFMKELGNRDSALYMWTTGLFLDFSLKVMEAWGYKYSSMAFVWLKLQSNGDPVHIYSPVTFPCCEFVIRGVRGIGVPVVERQQQLYTSARESHSKKPAEIRRRIERLHGPCRRVELFSREDVPGWDAYGDELGKPIPIEYSPGPFMKRNLISKS